MKYPSLPHAHDVQADLESIESGLCQAERFETVAELFKQLSDTTRLRIFWLLCHTEH